MTTSGKFLNKIDLNYKNFKSHEEFQLYAIRKIKELCESIIKLSGEDNHKTFFTVMELDSLLRYLDPIYGEDFFSEFEYITIQYRDAVDGLETDEEIQEAKESYIKWCFDENKYKKEIDISCEKILLEINEMLFKLCEIIIGIKS